MNSNDRPKLALLRGGRDVMTSDSDWDQFCDDIGWQPSAPLPDDYEDQLVDRIFGDDEVAMLPVAPDYVEASAPISKVVPISPIVTGLPVPRPRRWPAVVAVAAVAAAMLAGAWLHEKRRPAATRSVEPEVVPVRQRATPFTPLTPDAAPPVDRAAPVEPPRDSLVQSSVAPRPMLKRRTAPKRRKPVAPAAVAVAPARRVAPKRYEPQVARLAPEPIAPGESALLVAAATPLVGSPESLALAPSPSLEARFQVTPDALPNFPDWAGVGMSAPRDVGTTAGVRVMAQLDLQEAGRFLVEQL